VLHILFGFVGSDIGFLGADQGMQFFFFDGTALGFFKEFYQEFLVVGGA